MAQPLPAAVVQLFTSQSCSSCPPADALLSRLADETDVIALTLPVDYWNYTGWTDTLGLKEHTLRQRGYAAGRGERSLVTPQIVVNGTHVVDGNDKVAVKQAMADGAGAAGALTIPVTLRLEDDEIRVSLPEARSAVAAEVWVCPVSRSRTVTVEDGENRGRTLRYDYVVRGWTLLGTWTGEAEQLGIPVSRLSHDGADHVVVLVQTGTADKPGSILGAAALDIPPQPASTGASHVVSGRR